MTVHTAPHHLPHLHARTLVLATAGVALAGGAALGITQVLTSDEVTIAPEPAVTITEGARDSWEGRLQPAPVPGTEHGVRDSWMPPGSTAQELKRRE